MHDKDKQFKFLISLFKLNILSTFFYIHAHVRTHINFINILCQNGSFQKGYDVPGKKNLIFESSHTEIRSAKHTKVQNVSAFISVVLASEKNKNKKN
jgi:hypothetical protein